MTRMKPDDVQNFLSQQISEFKRKALLVLKEEAVRSVRRNFEAGGRPQWIRSKKKGKLKGTKTLIVSGTLMNVSTQSNEAELSVTVSTDPRASAYAKIQNEGGTINMPARQMKLRKKKYKNGSTRTVFASTKHKKITMETTSKPTTIKIPARPFLVIPQEDIDRMRQKISQIKV